jgi:hypothetical protein
VALRTVLDARHDLRHRLTKVEIRGISEKLEDLSSAADDHAALYANHLDNADLILQVSARHQSKVMMAQDIENYLYAFYYDMRRRRTGQSYAADRRALDQQAAYLCGIRKLSWSTDVKQILFGKAVTTSEDLQKALGDIVETGFTENPFVIECPSLTATFWEPDLSIVCEVGQRKLASIIEDSPDLDFKKYGWDVITSDTMDEYAIGHEPMVDVYHLETSETAHSPGYIYDVIAQAGNTSSEALMIEFIPNLAGRPWYSFAPGRITADTEDVVLNWKPLVASIYPHVQQLNLLQTLAQSGALITGRPQWQEVADGGQPTDYIGYHQMPANERPKIVFDLTNQLHAPPRPGFHYELFPVPDQKVVETRIDKKERDILRDGFPQILSPGATSEATSGYDRSTQMEPAINQLQPPLTNHADAWFELFMLALDIQKKLDIPISIPVLKRAQGESQDIKTTIKLKPAALSDFDLVVRFESIPAAQRFADDEADNRKLELGLMSRQTWMAKRYDDWEAEDERITNDQLAAMVKAKLMEQAQILLDEEAPVIAQEVLAEEGVPIPAPRPERPAGGSFPGLGSPEIPPPQDGPVVGTGAVGEAR